MLDLSTAGGHDNQTATKAVAPLLPPFGSGTEGGLVSCDERLGFGTAEAALVAAYYCVYTTDDLYH